VHAKPFVRTTAVVAAGTGVFVANPIAAAGTGVFVANPIAAAGTGVFVLSPLRGSRWTPS
jgi:hypothetical protein